ncbi:MAG: methyl-accepting chemotaxis protein [Leptothrix sp. (in: b-proteobacteria)]
MRLNTPLTQQEYHVPPGQALVSTTDLKGRILYCNQSFIAVSGYSKEELLGQPHNLIRHPDMPEEAFRDMWQTIQSGQPWSAPVKNRRKNGDHYWVMANVTPLLEGDQLAGYMSVRTDVTRQQVVAAEQLYARMRAEKAAGRLTHVLHCGELQRRDLVGRLLGRRPPVALQMFLCALLCGTVGLLAGRMAGGLPQWLGMVALLAGLSAGATAWLHQQTMRPVERLLTFANRMAAGDLSSQLNAEAAGPHRRFASALNQLAVNLRALVGDARDGVQHLCGTSDELASGNQDLSTRTESQAASLEQTASSMEQITGTVRQSAESARCAARIASEATEITRRSAESVHQVTATMHAISDGSQRIRDIIQVIDGIAFQTNLLALNAAVEAARAGEQGRGFAVVATEVRLLAQRTSVASREVRQLIDDAAQKVEIGAAQTDTARRTMDEALQAVQRMGALVGEIDIGANQQLTGITQVNQAVSHMDGLTQQNAALVEQLAAAAGSVRTQAQSVAEAVQVFTLERGAASKSMSDAPALRRQMKSLQAAAA